MPRLPHPSLQAPGRRRFAALTALVVLAAAGAAAAASLQESGLDLPGLWAARAAWGDYDDDGDLDLVLTGEALDESAQAVRLTRVYRNDGALLVEDVAQSGRLVGVYFGDVAWADYDGDGDLDLAVAGWDAGGDESLRLYVNQPGERAPDRLLTLDLAQVDDLGQSSFLGVRYASLAWADYDNDGDLDLVVSGMEANGVSRTQAYRNAGGLLALDASNSEAIVNVHGGDLAWADYDNDGDLDLAVSGESVGTDHWLPRVTEFYRNDPSGTLGLDVGLDLGTDPVTGMANRVKGGSLAWADYDGDGNLDLAVSGRDEGLNPVLNLFRNRPAGNLGDDASFSLSRAQRVDGALDWVDYDNDGDPDLAVAGRTSLSQYRALVLENRDGGVTGISSETDLEGLAGGTALWGDYDGNGRVDLLVAGADADGQRHTRVYANLGTATANQAPSPPASLNRAEVSSRRVIFSWSPGEDVESGSLTYNLRVGTDPGGNDIVSGRVPYGPGNAGTSTDYILQHSLPPDRYYWSVQAVDGAYARSIFSQEEIFTVGQFVSSDQRLRGLSGSAMSWGDVDGDGDVDLAMMGTNRSGEPQTLVYTNRAGSLTLGTETGLTALRNGGLEWADYDNDGDLDLMVTGQVTPGNRVSALYKTTASADAIRFDIEASLLLRPGLTAAAGTWGDVDNDGDLDLLLMGQSGEVEGGQQLSFTRVWVNDGQGSFDATRDDGLVGLNNGEAAWAD
ncbi:MAG: FG-GAP-like repeat-containing protein, partial [Gemmatimonadota bacterium]